MAYVKWSNANRHNRDEAYQGGGGVIRYFEASIKKNKAQNVTFLIVTSFLNDYLQMLEGLGEEL